VADAVAFAHSRGIVHRDLKPDNVMIGDFGEVLVMDWGLAVSVPIVPGTTVTQLMSKPRALPVTESTFGGTPGYMAPELTGPDLNKIGPWSDVYLLGAVLWRAVTGHPPHIGQNLRECLENARQNVIAEPENAAEACDQMGTTELLAIARKAMATKPEDRYRDVLAFQSALRAWQSHAQSTALSRRAATLLAKAANMPAPDYHDFAVAMYTYEEALNLWPENPCAADGLKHSRLSFARFGLKRGDVELADSVLAQAGGEAEDPELAKDIKAARCERACSEHQRAALARTAEKWSLAFELSPDAMIILRMEDAVVLEANANFEKVTGWPRSEVIGRSTADIGLWVDAEARTKFVSELQKSGEMQGYRARFRRRSGDEYDVLVSACVAQFDGVQAVVANSRDISGVAL
jgi:PAS domain S-box-containing protein